MREPAAEDDGSGHTFPIMSRRFRLSMPETIEFALELQCRFAKSSIEEQSSG
jgi:hypothetical protein